MYNRMLWSSGSPRHSKWIVRCCERRERRRPAHPRIGARGSTNDESAGRRDPTRGSHGRRRWPDGRGPDRPRYESGDESAGCDCKQIE
eukprot:scaffold8667_cov112-Isochrysis_galbana.AAC.3